MNKIRLSAALGAMALLGACATSPVTRAAPLETLPTGISDIENSSITDVTSVAEANWFVQAVRVNVPDSLSVSEANLYLPGTDIVWREDPYGDRRAQVRRILELATSQAAISMEGSDAVYLDIDLKRFHALSQKARATVGGWHTIDFDVTVRDATTDAVVVESTPVKIRLRAFGGQKAIDAEIRGETQKVRISREITSVMRQYLGT
jgi:uncharacterized protein DUF6778